MDSFEIDAGDRSCKTTQWFWVLAVMSSLQLLPALSFPGLVFVLGMASDDMHNETALQILAWSVYWLLSNATVNIVTLFLCIYAAFRYFQDPMLRGSSVVRPHFAYGAVDL
jgi:hypothetical protein